jgi:hypothetical protein
MLSPFVVTFSVYGDEAHKVIGRKAGFLAEFSDQRCFDRFIQLASVFGSRSNRFAARSIASSRTYLRPISAQCSLYLLNASFAAISGPNIKCTIERFVRRTTARSSSGGGRYRFGLPGFLFATVSPAGR